MKILLVTQTSKDSFFDFFIYDESQARAIDDKGTCYYTIDCRMENWSRCI